MRPVVHSILPLLLALAPIACAGAEDDASSGEDALTSCAAPDAGPLKAAARWVRPGGFVNIEVDGDANVEVRAEKLEGAVGTPSVRKFGSGGRASFVVEFDAAAKGFFRVVGSRQKKDVGEIRVRVSDAVPRLLLGAPGEGGKIDPVVTLNGSSVALTGSVLDELGSPATVAIGGNRQTVKNGQFTLSIPSTPGVNLVDAEVIDVACNSYPVTGAFVAASSRGGTGLLHVRAAQSTVDKVAALVSEHFTEIVKVPADPNPIANTFGKNLFLDGIDFPSQPGSAHVSLSVENGRFGLHVAIDGQLITHARVNSTPVEIRVNNFVLDGNLSVASNGRFGLSVSHVDGKVAVDVADFGVPLLGLFQGVIHKAIGASISKFAPPIIEKALAGQNGDIPLPLPWAPSSRPATIHYALGGIGVTRTGLTADVKTTVAGSPVFGKVADIAAPAEGELGLGVPFVTVNQALYAIWKKGAFNPALSSEDIHRFDTGIPLPAFLKEAQINIAVDNPLVPPVVMPSADGKQIHVGVGALPMRLFVQGSGISTKLDAEVAVNADFGVRVEGNAVRVDVVKADPHARITGRIDVNATLDDVTALMKDLSVRIAELLAASSVTMPIPAFDLAGTGIAGLDGTQVIATDVGIKIGQGGVAVRGTAAFLR